MSKVLSILYLFSYFLVFVSTVYGQTASPNVGPPAAGLDWIQDAVRRIIQLTTGFAFVALLVMLVSAGVKYLTSGGEAKSLQSAHMTMTWAIIGMLILVIAWLILLLLEVFTGLKLSVFDVKILCTPGILGCP